MFRESNDYDFWGNGGTSYAPVSNSVNDPLNGIGSGSTSGGVWDKIPGSGDEMVSPFPDPTPYGGATTADFGGLPSVPQFHAPRFTVPGAEGMYADPGYQFRLSQGVGALQNSQAGKGILRTGGSLKNLADYAENSASQEYSNVFDRAIQSYDKTYQAARDEFAPNLLGYQNNYATERDRAIAEAQDEWNRYTYGQDLALRQQQLAGGLEPL